MPARIDLTMFLDPDCRFPEPWWFDDDHGAATEGRILVIVERNAIMDADFKQTTARPDAAAVMKPIGEVRGWNPLPEFPPCRQCSGSGFRWTEETDEFGEYEGYQHCNCYVPFGERKVARHLANKLLSLPGCQWGVTNNPDHTAIFLRFVGGTGAMMPLSKQEGGE